MSRFKPLNTIYRHVFVPVAMLSSYDLSNMFIAWQRWKGGGRGRWKCSKCFLWSDSSSRLAARVLLGQNKQNKLSFSTAISLLSIYGLSDILLFYPTRNLYSFKRFIDKSYPLRYILHIPQPQHATWRSYLRQNDTSAAVVT